jgi:hypothetical protein
LVTGDAVLEKVNGALKPMVPNALEAIDQRIDIVWRKTYESDEDEKEFKNNLKSSIRRMLLALDMVKTPQEYAKEEIQIIS